MSTVEAWNPPFVGAGQVRYFSLARHALIEALCLAGVRPGSRVLLPEYVCRDLLAPLHLLGAVPCWYSVAADMTLATDPAVWPAADVVLAVNYFGFPQDLTPFQAYAARTSAVVIEDNAHGYLSRDQNGQWLGCRTGLGVFSMRKTLRIPDGAALWVGPEYAGFELSAQVAMDGAGVNPAQLIKARLRSLPMLGELAYRLSTLLVRKLRKWRTGSEVPATDPASEQMVPASANPWAGLLPALAAFAVPAEIERRRAAYVRCAVVGERVGAQPVFAALPPNCVPYAYAFRGGEFAVCEMRHFSTSQGFNVSSWPELPYRFYKDDQLHYADVYMVNFLW